MTLYDHVLFLCGPSVSFNLSSATFVNVNIYFKGYGSSLRHIYLIKGFSCKVW